MEPSFVQKDFDARHENTKAMLGFIESFAAECRLPSAFVNQLLIVGDELFSNIINHGYHDQGGLIRVSLSFHPSEAFFEMNVKDRSAPFNPLELPDAPEVPLHIGGLGIPLVRMIMDECAYSYEEGCNSLTLKKRL